MTLSGSAGNGGAGEGLRGSKAVGEEGEGGERRFVFRGPVGMDGLDVRAGVAAAAAGQEARSFAFQAGGVAVG